MKHRILSNWINPLQYLNFRPNIEVLSWLEDRDSLTRRLIKQCQGSFSVQVLSQQWGKAQLSEAKLLGIPLRQRVLLRQVLLKCDNNLNVFARSIIPLKTLRGRHKRLKYLGEKPLGGYLFSISSLKRNCIEWFYIQQQNELRDNMLLNDENQTRNFWGRRSLFLINQKPLLVTEFFLPGLFLSQEKKTREIKNER